MRLPNLAPAALSAVATLLVLDGTTAQAGRHHRPNTPDPGCGGSRFCANEWTVGLVPLSPIDRRQSVINSRDEEEDVAREWCNRRSWTTETREYFSDEVSKYLHQALTSEGANNWVDNRWYEGTVGNDPSGAGCHDLTFGWCVFPGECTPQHARNYHVMAKISVFFRELRLVKAAMSSGWMDGSSYKDALLQHLPTNGDEAGDRPTMISLLASIGNSFAMVGGTLGDMNDPLTSSILSTAGGILALTKENIAEELKTQVQDVGDSLNLISKGYSEVIRDIQGRILGDGNVTGLPVYVFRRNVDRYRVSSDDRSSRHNVNRLVNFFHDRFWEHPKRADGSVRDEVNTNLKRLLTNYALREGNYYIIKGGYDEPDCREQNTGEWLNGHCYTLEHQNGGRSSDSRRTQYSVPVSGATAYFLTSEAAFDFQAFYINAEDCQTRANEYYATAPFKFDGALTAYNGKDDKTCTSKDKAKCFPQCSWNIPVVSVRSLPKDYRGSDAAQASPCDARLKKLPTDSAKAGENYLPPKLEASFSSSYCS